MAPTLFPPGSASRIDHAMWPASILGFGVSVAYWPGWLSAAVAPRWCLLAAGLPLCSRLDPRNLDPAIMWLLFGMAVYSALSLAWSLDPALGAGEFFHLLIVLVAILVGASIPDMRPVMVAVSIGLTVSAVIAVFQWFGYSPVVEIRGPAGLFYNKLILGETVAPLFVWNIFARRWPLAGILLVPLILTKIRVAIFAVLVVLAYRYRRQLMVPLIVLGIYTLLASIYQWAPFYGADANSFAERILIWKTALGGIAPLGHGIGSFAVLYPHWEYAHSDFLQLIFETGDGSILFFAVAAILIIRGGRSPESAALAAMGIEALVSFPLHMPATAMVAGLLVGHLGRRSQLRDSRSLGGDYVVAGH